MPLIINPYRHVAAGGAFPSVAASATYSSSSNVNTHPLNVPARTAGDLMLMIVGNDDDADTVSVANLDAVSWVSLYSNHPAGADAGVQVWYLFAGAGGAATTVTGTVNTGDENVVSACLAVTAAHASAAPESAATSEAVDPPSLSPSWGSAKTLWIPVFAAGRQDEYATVAPTNYGGLLVARHTGGGGTQPSVSLATRQLEAASENPGTFTLTASTSPVSAITIAIRPA